MESITIENFKYGLDARRTVLTSQPGTLQTAENVVVDAGGVIRKRFAFTLFAELAILDSLGAQGTFGLQETDSGLMTFGSALAFDSAVTLGQPTLASAMPTGVTYQQLKHPEMSGGRAFVYAAVYHRMTKVVFSIANQGKAFVAAKFTDGRTYLYYNGTVVNSSFAGVVLPSGTNATSLATELSKQVDLLDGWQHVAYDDGTGLGSYNATSVIKAPPGANFTPVPTETSALGSLGSKLISPAGDTAEAAHLGTPGKGAAVAFLITADGTYGVATCTVTAPATSSGSGTSTLCTGVLAQGTVAATASEVARAINDSSMFTGYTAEVNGANVTVHAPASFGNVTFDLTVTMTGGMTQAAGIIGYTIVLTLTPANLIVTSQKPKHDIVSGTVAASTVGARGAVTLLWEEETADSGNSISLSSTTGETVSFSKKVKRGDTEVGNFKCTATDASGFISVVLFTVKLNNTVLPILESFTTTVI